MNTVEMDPEITTFKRTINTMMDQLQVFSSEVSRVAREVGTEGILGGQAQIEGVDGTWKELTYNGEFDWAQSSSLARPTVQYRLLTSVQSMSWRKTSRIKGRSLPPRGYAASAPDTDWSSARDRLRHHGCGLWRSNQEDRAAG